MKSSCSDFPSDVGKLLGMFLGLSAYNSHISVYAFVYWSDEGVDEWRSGDKISQADDRSINQQFLVLMADGLLTGLCFLS